MWICSCDLIICCHKKNPQSSTLTCLIALCKPVILSMFENLRLIYAAVNGDLPGVQKMLRKGADVNAKHENGSTSLILASQNGHVDVVRELSKSGADVNAKNQFGDTSLTSASRKGDVDMVRELLRRGADVNATGACGYTSLTTASFFKDDVDVVRELLKSGADVDATNKYVDTALINASSRGHVNVVRELLKGGADVNANKGAVADTSLIRASNNGHVDVVRELLKSGADVNAKNAFFVRETALINASGEGHVNVVRELLKSGADVNAKKHNGDTSLILARRHGHVDVVRELLKSGADVPTFFSILVEDDSSPVDEKLNKLVDTMHCRLELRVFYTFLRSCVARQVLLVGEARTSLGKALTKMAKTCSSHDDLVTYKIVLSKCRKDKMITESNFHAFDNQAEVKLMEQAEFYLMGHANFYLDIHSCNMTWAIRHNTAGIRGLEGTVGVLKNNIRDLHQQIRQVNDSVEKVKTAFRHKKKVEGAVSFVSAILNIASFNLRHGVDMIFNRIVDFGDAAHIREVIAIEANPQEANAFAESFQAGVDIAREATKCTGALLIQRKLDVAIRKNANNPLLLLGITATFVHIDIDNQVEAEAASPTSATWSKGFFWCSLCNFSKS
jgi:ankyrin repeat protein